MGNSSESDHFYPPMPHAPSTISVLIGCGAAVAIAFVAWRKGSLSGSGAIAAAIGGALSMIAGLPWGIFLVVWFLYASLLSRAGRDAKAARTGEIIAKGGRRDAWQVLANGGVYFVLAAWTVGTALGGVSGGSVDLAVLAAAALVAAGADTTATEVGTWWRGASVSVRTWQQVPAGTSGAVSLMGSLAMVAAAVILAGVAVTAGLIPSPALWVVAAAGVAGAVTDTLLGATLQARRICLRCGKATEQRVHRCGGDTRLAGGLAWMDNDMVNALCTLTAAGIAALLLVVMG